MNPVFMFSGQGAQKPGMGESLFCVSEVKAVLDCASDVLGYDVAELMTSAPAEKLNDTRYAQPATCALSVGIASALQARGAQPQAVLGFSLGQVSALAVSGMLTYEETFSFVAERARLMAQAAAERPGVMSALLKADEESVAQLCEGCAQGQVLVPANFNCPGQIVISGELAAVERAEAAWEAAGKRYVRLATSGAFHSPLMQPAADELDVYLAKVDFRQPSIPLICNTDAQPLSAEVARRHLVDHLTHPVRFEQSVQALAAQGVSVFAEVGFGGVLSNLVKRIDRKAARPCIQDAASFDAFVSRYAEDKDFRLMSESPDTTRRASACHQLGFRVVSDLAVAEQLAAAGFNVALNCSSEAGLPTLRVSRLARSPANVTVQVNEPSRQSVADEAGERPEPTGTAGLRPLRCHGQQRRHHATTPGNA